MAIASQYIRGAKVVPVKIVRRSGAAALYVVGEVGNPTLSSAVTTKVPADSVEVASISSTYSTEVT